MILLLQCLSCPAGGWNGFRVSGTTAAAVVVDTSVYTILPHTAVGICAVVTRIHLVVVLFLSPLIITTVESASELTKTDKCIKIDEQ